MKDRRDPYADAYSEQYELLHTVIEKYIEVCELPRISALALDDDGDVIHPRVLMPGSLPLYFKVDCERITERILQDKPDLQVAWFALAQQQPIKARDEQKLVRLLGRAYGAIRPSNYFRPRRNGSAQSQRRAA